MNTPRNFTLPVILALSVAAATPGQLSVTHTAKTNITAYAYYTNYQPVTQEIAAGTDLLPSKSLSARSRTQATWSGSASATSGGVSAVFRAASNGRYSSFTSRGSASVRGTTLLTIKYPRPLKATLRVSWTPRPSNAGSRGVGAVDIGDDQSFDFAAYGTALTKDFAVTIDSTGLPLAIQCTASSTGSPAYTYTTFSGTLSLTLLPPETCLFFSHGTSCGLTLSGSNGFDNTVRITATGGAASGTGLLVLGLTRTSQPLPGSNCLLLVRPLNSLPIVFDANGSFSVTGSLPKFRPFALPLQIGSFGTTLGTSNALTIICP